MPAPLGLGHSDDWTRSFLRLEVRFHSSGLGSGCQQNSLCYTPRIRLRYVVNAASSMQRTTVQWTNAGAQSQPARNLAAWLASLSMAGQLRSQLRIRPGKSASRPERRLGDRSASSSSPARENRRDHFRRISKWRTQGSLAGRRRPAGPNACFSVDRTPGVPLSSQGRYSGSVHGDSRPSEPLAVGPRIPRAFLI